MPKVMSWVAMLSRYMAWVGVRARRSARRVLSTTPAPGASGRAVSPASISCTVSAGIGRSSIAPHRLPRRRLLWGVKVCLTIKLIIPAEGPRDGAARTAMIGKLTGTLSDKNPPQLLVDCHGVGYEVDVPMSTFYNLPGLGEKVSLLTHFVVREDAQILYGFGTAGERDAF